MACVLRGYLQDSRAENTDTCALNPLKQKGSN
jgi:hypothetical protein